MSTPITQQLGSRVMATRPSPRSERDPQVSGFDLGPVSHAATVGIVTVVSSFLFELLGKLPFSSDQGIISLMALDILESGKHPIFCYGSEYGGTVEAHFLAVMFGLFGATPMVFRLAMGVLTVLVTLTVWAIARVAFGERAGLLSGLYLAAGPSYFFYKCLTSDGGYVSLLLSCGLALLALLVSETRIRERRRATAPLAVFGVSLGLAWWILPLALGLIVACAVALILAWRVRPSVVQVATAAGGALLGALPWIYHNARSGLSSLKAAEMGIVDVHELGSNLHGLFRFGWTIVLGGAQVWTLSSTWPAILLTSVLLAFVLVHSAQKITRERSESLRFAMILFVSMVLAPALLSLAARRTDYREPRYLLLCYLGLAPLIGALLDSCWHLRWPRTALLAWLALLGPMSQWTAPVRRNLEMTGLTEDASRVSRQLEQLGTRELYASYWIAYRLTFLSHRRLMASPFGGGTDGYVRDRDLAARVDKTPSPAFLFCCADRRSFDSFLTHERVPYERADLGLFRLYRNLPSPLVQRLRLIRSVPFSMGPGDIQWQRVDGPKTLSSGSSSEWKVDIVNRWIQKIPSNVHLSYQWTNTDGSLIVHDGLRTEIPLQRNEDAGHISIRAKVLANVPPGNYRLRFDLVHEAWCWFAEFGIKPPTVDVLVTPGLDARK